MKHRWIMTTIVITVLIASFLLAVPYWQRCAEHHGVIVKGTCYTPTGIYWPWQ